MLRKLILLMVILLILSAAGGGYWYFSQNPDQLTQLQLRLGLISQAQATGAYSVSGFIEAEEISIVAETGGRIAEITVAEGDFVQAGHILVKLDTALLEADLREVEARIATAKTHLAQIKAGVRSEEIARAEAAVAAAEAEAETARTRWQDAVTLRDNPQELDRQIDAARTALKLAQLRVEFVIPLKDNGELLEELRYWQWHDIQRGLYVNYDDPRTGEGVRGYKSYPEGVEQQASVNWNRATTDQWEAWVNLNEATAAQDNAETTLNDLLRLKNDPQEAELQVAQAKAAYDTALAQAKVARAQVEILQAGTPAEQIAVAEAQVRQAEASLIALAVLRDQHTLSAPLSGWVVERTAHEGEMAVPGVTLMTLADLGNLTLTVYVPAPDIGSVSFGQEVKVLVDTFPDEPFTGRISFISDEAEFTPKNVQTKEERVTTVFAVKIKLDNPDQRLKPGMPADAILSEEPVL